MWDWISWAANFIPWWVWPIALAVVVIAFLPYITPIWNMLPRPLKAAIIAVLGLFTAYWAGRNKGAKDERDKTKKQTDQAITKRQEVHDEVSKLTPSEVDRRLDERGDFRD
jgi:hypothetical protein